MTPEYIKYLKDVIKLAPTDTTLGVKDKQEMKCLLCGEIYVATPQSKVQNFRKYPAPGCPQCVASNKFSEADKRNVVELKKLGFVLLESYKGLRVPIIMKNTRCDCGGTPWKVEPHNVLQGRSMCAPCNTKRKRDSMIAHNKGG